MPNWSRVADKTLLVLVRWYCFVRHPIIMVHAISGSRRIPNPSNPRTIEDKFLWRKLFDHNPLFSIACDKLASKAYVIDRLPELTTAQVLWSGTEPAEIPDHVLMGDVVFKANHGSGWNLLLRAGEAIDRDLMDKLAGYWLSKPYGRRKGEWGYSNSLRTLIVEQMLLSGGQPVQSEYKFHVCSGTTAYVYHATPGSMDGQPYVVLDREGTAFSPTEDGTGRKTSFNLPGNFHDMLRLAEKIAEPFDFARIDLYNMEYLIYFSEITIYPLSGKGKIGVEHLSILRNQLWDLRKSWFLNTPQIGWKRLYSDALNRCLHDAS